MMRPAEGRAARLLGSVFKAPQTNKRGAAETLVEEGPAHRHCLATIVLLEEYRQAREPKGITRVGVYPAHAAAIKIPTHGSGPRIG